MNRLFKTSLLVAAMLPAFAVAAPVAGDREVTLSGAGSSDKDFDDTVFSVQGSWGTYLDESSMWGVRQTVNARDSEGESVQFDGSTRVFYDYHFGSGKALFFGSYIVSFVCIASCSAGAQPSTSSFRKFCRASPGSSSSDVIIRIPHWLSISSCTGLGLCENT